MKKKNTELLLCVVFPKVWQNVCDGFVKVNVTVFASWLRNPCRVIRKPDVTNTDCYRPERAIMKHPTFTNRLNMTGEL